MTRPLALAAPLLALAVLGTGLAGLFAAADSAPADLPWRYVAGVLRFTLLQATLSTLVAVAAGAALALSLARRRFPGRAAFIAALNLASVLPAIVASFGIVAVLGRGGWLGQGARALGFDPGSWLYGLPGILIAHVFFNVPLAARVFLAALAAVPGEHWRLAAQLGMRPAALFRLVDWPVIRREAPGVATLVFILCFTSFAIVLALGGGPNAATLEVAIYSAVRFDVDFARAGTLALIQIAVGLAAVAPLAWLGRAPAEAPALGVIAERPDAASPALRRWDPLVIGAAALLVLPPLAATLLAGLAGLKTLFAPEVARALATSFAIAAPAAILAVALALATATLSRAPPELRGRGPAAILSLAPVAVLAMPPVAISAGLFVAIRPLADPFALAIPLIVVMNALFAFPFALRQVEPPLRASAERTGRLADSLGITGLARLRLVDMPILRGPAAAALAVAAALSLGDLGAAAFFGSGKLTTLPLLLYQRLGGYRTEAAAAVALLLAALVLALFLAAARISGSDRGGALARDR